MNDSNEKFLPVYNNNLVRFLTLRSYFYLYRLRVDGKYVVYYKNSPLLQELLSIYYSMSKEERSTYVNKFGHQKAE